MSTDKITNAQVASEQLKLRNFLTHAQQQADIESRELQDKHADDVNRVVLNHADQMDDLKKAYEVQISKEAEGLEERLHDVRMSNEERIAAEKRAGEEQLHKIQTSQQQKVDEYRKNSESQLENMRKQLQAQTEQLHEAARKSARKEGASI